MKIRTRRKRVYALIGTRKAWVGVRRYRIYVKDRDGNRTEIPTPRVPHFTVEEFEPGPTFDKVEGAIGYHIYWGGRCLPEARP